MKKIIFILLTILIVFFIYFLNIDRKVFYLSIGDYLAYGINNLNIVDNNYSDNIKNKYNSKLKQYINYSSIDDYRVTDLINDIKYNKTIIYKEKEYKIQNLLIKANLITISIGMNDLLYKNNIDKYEYGDELLKDMEKLLFLIRKYNKDKIYVLSFYNIINNEELITYLNKKLMSICEKNNIQYVDISKLNNYIIIGKYPTNDGYSYITNKLIYY